MIRSICATLLAFLLSVPLAPKVFPYDNTDVDSLPPWQMERISESTVIYQRGTTRLRCSKEGGFESITFHRDTPIPERPSFSHVDLVTGQTRVMYVVSAALKHTETAVILTPAIENKFFSIQEMGSISAEYYNRYSRDEGDNPVDWVKLDGLEEISESTGITCHWAAPDLE